MTSGPIWTDRSLGDRAGHDRARGGLRGQRRRNSKRPRLRRLLADARATTIVVEHHDRLARFGVEHLEAALSAQGCRLLVVDLGGTSDDLMRDILEVLTGFCVRLYGRRGARNRALRAVTCAKRPPEVTGVAVG